MQLTTLEPISPTQVSRLLREVRTVDAFAQLRVDPDGRTTRITGDLTAAQMAAAIHAAGVDGALEAEGHVSGGSTCCGGCS